MKVTWLTWTLKLGSPSIQPDRLGRFLIKTCRMIRYWILNIELHSPEMLEHKHDGHENSSQFAVSKL